MDEVGVCQPSLRERKKAATMRAVQRVAIEMFERDGFDAVRIEQVAAAAEVSPSTIYRYFGTKEGLVLHDEFDDGAIAVYVGRIAGGLDPLEAARQTLDEVMGQHVHVDDEEMTRRRTTLWVTTPAVWSAGLQLLDETVEQVAHAVADVTEIDVRTVRLGVSVVVWPLVAAIRSWHDAGADPHGWIAEVQRALDILPDRLPGWPRPGA